MGMETRQKLAFFVLHSLCGAFFNIFLLKKAWKGATYYFVSCVWKERRDRDEMKGAENLERKRLVKTGNG